MQLIICPMLLNLIKYIYEKNLVTKLLGIVVLGLILVGNA